MSVWRWRHDPDCTKEDFEAMMKVVKDATSENPEELGKEVENKLVYEESDKEDAPFGPRFRHLILAFDKKKGAWSRWSVRNCFHQAKKGDAEVIVMI